MKTISWFIHRDYLKEIQMQFFFTPYLSINSLFFHPKKDESLYVRFLTFGFLTLASLVLAHRFFPKLEYLQIVILSPLIYFFTETISSFGQILFFQYPTYPMHRSPYLATSLSHFWGKDWNLWVQDWLRDVSKSQGKKSKSRRILLVFFLSGLFHEAMVNLPYFLVFKKSYFGTMVAYFCIQAVALWLDKKFISRTHPLIRRIYMWLAIILPSPLFINVPLLTFFGLKT